MGPVRKGVPYVERFAVPFFMGSRVSSTSCLSRAGSATTVFRLPRTGDGLQVFRAPHRPDAAPPGDALAVLPVVGEAREAHAVLAGRADGQHVGLGAVRGLDRLHRVRVVFPQTPRASRSAAPSSSTAR